MSCVLPSWGVAIFFPLKSAGTFKGAFGPGVLTLEVSQEASNYVFDHERLSLDRD